MDAFWVLPSLTSLTGHSVSCKNIFENTPPAKILSHFAALSNGAQNMLKFQHNLQGPYCSTAQNFCEMVSFVLNFSVKLQYVNLGKTSRKNTFI